MRQPQTLSTFLPFPARGRARHARPAVPVAPAVLERLPRLLSRLGTGLAVLVLLVAGTLLAFRSSYGDKVYPSVAVADVNVGGLSPTEAQAALQARAAALEQGTITFSYSGKTWSPTLAELGAAIDIQGAFDEAYQLGREGNAWDRLVSTTRLAREETSIPLRITLDQTTLNGWFDRVDADLGLRPRNASIVVQGTTVSIEPEVDGTIVDRGQATGRVQEALQGLTSISEPLPVVSQVSKVRTPDLAGAQQQLQQALSRPLSVQIEDQTWSLAPSDLGQFVVQQVDPAKSGAEAVSITLDEDRLTAWLSDQFTSRVNREPVDATVGWNEGPVALTDSVDGVTLKPRSFARTVAEAFFGDPKPIEIPVTVTKPTVDSNNLAALGIDAEIAVGDTNYRGSQDDRTINVETGANLLNGTLVPPGGEFDFNRAVGEITEDAGFVEANVIAGERIDRDIGGGICTVSTTVFRAALKAGFPITEWNPHRYRLPVYEANGWELGYDASILQPEGDPFAPGNSFKFANPTDNWLLIESWGDGANVIVKIYGSDPGYDVKISEPTRGAVIPPGHPQEVVDERLEPGTIVQAEFPADGIEVWFTRDVYDQDGTLLESRKFYTLYNSYDPVWRVSPDMQGKSPATAG